MQDICPNCKRVTCEGCEDEDKYIRATRHIAQQIREKNKRDQEIVQRHIESIRKILSKEG